MKICIAGGTGMVGGAVKKAAEEKGFSVTVVHVPRPEKGKAHDPEEWAIALEQWQPEHFSGFDAVMFFGGEPINSRWTDRKLQRIELSRQMPCRRIAELVTSAAEKPKVIVSASATGYYGDTGDAVVTEESAVGRGFLAPTTATWEATWEKAKAAGIRVVLLRLGVVLSKKSGALKVMLPAFKMGFGGPMGSGKQWMPWITEQDAGRLALWCAEEPTVEGPVNGVATEPVRQKDFAKALGAVLKRPAIVPVPRPALRLGFGKMADETVLSSCRAVPRKAEDGGFVFQQGEIVGALRSVLG